MLSKSRVSTSTDLTFVSILISEFSFTSTSNDRPLTFTLYFEYLFLLTFELGAVSITVA